MDVDLLKGRIGEAFVERILCLAGYKVCRTGRESQLQQMLKEGRSEFLPDFLVWRQVDRASDGAPLNRVLNIEVKYRHDVPDYLRRFGAEFLDAARQWPELYVIVVTDNPEPGRSCFQTLNPRACAPDTPLTTIDLHEVGELDIYRSTVADYEGLVKEIFSLLGAQLRGRDPARKPLAKAPCDSAPPFDTLSARAQDPSS